MSFSISTLFERIHKFRVPIAGSPFRVCLMGVLNFVLFGWGTIVSGFANDCKEDILIGVLQFLLPVVGWIWSVIWGFLMISRKVKQSRYDNAYGSTPVTEP